MNKLMIDIETLSTQPNAVVLSIGAVIFNDNGIIDSFYTVLDAEIQVTRDICHETVKWWNNQDYRIKEELFDNPYKAHPKFSLDTFNEFITMFNPSEIWANGPDFDCIILNSLSNDFLSFNILDFRKYRCFRTLKKLIPLDESEIAPNTSAHNALSDAVWQANYVIQALKKLNGNIPK